MLADSDGAGTGACTPPEAEAHTQGQLPGWHSAEADQEMQDEAQAEERLSDDMALLPDPHQLPPGTRRSVYRGLSITIPPEEEDDPDMNSLPLSSSISAGLSIRVYQVRAVRSKGRSRRQTWGPPSQQTCLRIA